MHLPKSITSLFILALLFSCADKQGDTSPNVIDTSWSLVKMGTELPTGVEIKLRFERDRISGKGVCNNYFSKYALEGSKITIEAVGASKMMCSKHSDLEAKYFQALRKAESITMQKEELVINSADGVLVFRPLKLDRS